MLRWVPIACYRPESQHIAIAASLPGLANFFQHTQILYHLCDYLLEFSNNRHLEAVERVPFGLV